MQKTGYKTGFFLQLPICDEKMKIQKLSFQSFLN